MASYVKEEDISVLCLTYNVNGKKLIRDQKKSVPQTPADENKVEGRNSSSRSSSHSSNSEGQHDEGSRSRGLLDDLEEMDSEIRHFAAVFDCSSISVRHADIIVVGLEETIEMSASDIGGTVIAGTLNDVVEHWRTVVPRALNAHTQPVRLHGHPSSSLLSAAELLRNDNNDDDHHNHHGINSNSNADSSSSSSDASYVEIACVHMLGIWSAAYCKAELRPYLTDIAVATHARGPGGFLGTKGGVYIRFNVYNTSFCAITAHLAAHREHTHQRNEDFKSIMLSDVFEDKDVAIRPMGIVDVGASTMRRFSRYRQGMAPLQVKLTKIRQRIKLQEVSMRKRGEEKKGKLHQDENSLDDSTELSKRRYSTSAGSIGATATATATGTDIDADGKIPSNTQEVIQMHVASTEKVLLTSLMGKRNPYGFVQSRQLVLTSKPSLIYLDIGKKTKNGDIEFSDKYPIIARKINVSSFEVSSSPEEKVYTFSVLEDSKGSKVNTTTIESRSTVDVWVDAINAVTWQKSHKEEKDEGEEAEDDDNEEESSTFHANDANCQSKTAEGIHTPDNASNKGGASMCPEQSLAQDRLDLYGALDHDIVFFLGDLNYRIAELDINTVYSYIDAGEAHKLLPYDQLNIARSTNVDVVASFEEGELTFPPSYKFIPSKDKIIDVNAPRLVDSTPPPSLPNQISTDPNGSHAVKNIINDSGSIILNRISHRIQTFTSSVSAYDRRPEKKMRVPAWCDRVLWKVRDKRAGASRNWRKASSVDFIPSERIEEVKQLSYEWLPEFVISDHKPVRSLFSVKTKRIDFAMRERQLCAQPLRLSPTNDANDKNGSDTTTPTSDDALILDSVIDKLQSYVDKLQNTSNDIGNMGSREYQMHADFLGPCLSIKPSGLHVYHMFLHQKDIYHETVTLRCNGAASEGSIPLLFKVFNYSCIHSIRSNNTASDSINNDDNNSSDINKNSSSSSGSSSGSSENDILFYEGSMIPPWLKIRRIPESEQPASRVARSTPIQSNSCPCPRIPVASNQISANGTALLTLSFESDPFVDPTYMRETPLAFQTEGECSLILGIDLIGHATATATGNAVKNNDGGVNSKMGPREGRRKLAVLHTIILPIHIFRNNS